MTTKPKILVCGAIREVFMSRNNGGKIRTGIVGIGAVMATFPFSDFCLTLRSWPSSLGAVNDTLAPMSPDRGEALSEPAP
jgi:hypothetical protein